MAVVAERVERDARAYSGETEVPLGSYAVIVAAFNAGLGALLYTAARSGRLPERIAASDVLLLGISTHKLARLIAKDTVTAPLRAPFTTYQGGAGANEISETPRGNGPRKAIGELLFCPPCVGQWVAAASVGGLLHAPRLTRTVSSVFAVQAIADFLHAGFAAARDRAF